MRLRTSGKPDGRPDTHCVLFKIFVELLYEDVSITLALVTILQQTGMRC